MTTRRLQIAAGLAAAISALGSGCTSGSTSSPEPTGQRRPIVRELATRLDASLEARLGRSVPLRYGDGGSAAEDRPPFVRAASAIRRWGNEYAIVQDDVGAVGLGSLEALDRLEAMLLPRSPDGRRRFEDALGNLDQKLDLEAAAVLPDRRLVLFGSGSTRAREQIVVITRPDTVKLVDARELYAHLRSQKDFSGSELNVEGALVSEGVLRLFQRGNGAPAAGLQPANAIGDVPLAELVRWLDNAGPVPMLTHVARFTLGRIGMARLGFTDAALQRDGTIAVLACAEDSPDAVHDGEVLGCRFGLLDPDGARLTDILDAGGRLAPLKLEGIEARDDASVFDVVADPDDPNAPAFGAELRVTQGVTPGAAPRAR